MVQLLTAARKAGLRVFYAMHHRYRPGDYESWKHVEYSTWGGEFRAEFSPQPGDIVAQERGCSSRFAKTDLDLQLKRCGVQKPIVVGAYRAHVYGIDGSLCR